MTDTTLRCAICPATIGAALAGGWTWRTLAEPVTYRSIFPGPLPPTPAADYALCPACSAWAADDDRHEKPLPPGVTAAIAAQVADADLNPLTARRLRAEMVGMVRHLADRLQPRMTRTTPRGSRGNRRGRKQPTRGERS